MKLSPTSCARFLAFGLACTPVAAFASGCAGPAPSDPTSSADHLTASAARDGKIPTYSGEGFTGAQILRLSDGAWLTEDDFTKALAEADVTFFGEEHMTAPVQAMEKWLLGDMIAKVPDLGVAMEHFQHDEQPIIDEYFAGQIDQATFEATAQVWTGYATYWRQVVETAHAAHRPLVGLNVPDEILSSLYNQFPTWPIDAFNAIPDSAPRADTLPARPIASWDPTYQGWFESEFDYNAHGAQLGLDYADALHYFTDLAQIRDETMALWVSRSMTPANPHVMVFAGDWHVQTRLSVPDRVARLSPNAKIVTITTSPADGLDDLRHFQHAGRAVADYIIAYTPPPAPPAPPSP